MFKASSLALALAASLLCFAAPALADPPLPDAARAAPAPSAPATSSGYGAPAQSSPPPYGPPPSYSYSPPPGYPPPPVPSGAPAEPPELSREAIGRYERASPGLMLGGIILTTIGGVGMISAGILAETAAGCSDCTAASVDNRAIASLTLLVVGAICVGIGVPLIVVGGKRAPRSPQQAVRVKAPLLRGLKPQGFVF